MSLTAALLWRQPQLADALQALSTRAGLTTARRAVGDPPVGDDLTSWMSTAAAQLVVEAVAVTLSGAELEAMLRTTGPVLASLPAPLAGHYLAILSGGRRTIRVLGPDGSIHRVRRQEVFEALTTDLRKAQEGAARELMARLSLNGPRWAPAIQALGSAGVADDRIGGVWLLRPSPASSPWIQARHARLPGLLIGVLAAHAAGYLLFLLSWWILGQGALSGYLSEGALQVWTLLLLTFVLLRVVDTWAQHRLSVDAGALVKEILLAGIFQLRQREVQRRGVGRFLSTAMEADLFSSGMAGVLLVLVSLVDLCFGFVILVLGTGGLLHALALALALWAGLGVVLFGHYLRRARLWIESYREMSHDLIERMVGYHTRLIQERPEQLHLEEDRLLDRYQAAARRMDRLGTALQALVGRGWLLVGMFVLTPSLLDGASLSAEIAVAAGVMLWVSQSLKQLVSGLIRFVDVVVSWEQTSPLLTAARRPRPEARPAPSHRGWWTPDGPLVAFSDLSLRYTADGPLVLRGCEATILQGDHVLLEGPSGGGKSSLVAVVAGLERPSGGELLLNGTSWQAVPVRKWRRHVVLVPQLHVNHVFTAPLAFNLLMGVGWPPSRADLKRARRVCEALGLAEVIAQMPQHLWQMVGDGGWQLSQGERSRLVLARALLQEPALLLVDESFAALDPEIFLQAFSGVTERAETLLVVAHP